MGTSSSFKGPVGRPDLLPPWAPPPPDTPPPSDESGSDTAPPELPDQSPLPGGSAPLIAPLGVSWRGPKSAFSHLVSGRTDSPRSAFRSYVRAHGGARRAAATAISSRQSTARLMGFLSDVARRGIVEAARRLGIRDLIGRDVSFTLASLIDFLAPAGSLLEEAVARSATIDTLFEFCGRYDLAEAGLQALDAITADDLGVALRIAVSNVVDVRFKEELTSRVERGDVSERDGNRIFSEIGEFVRGMVDLRLADRDLLSIDWGGPEGAAFVEQVYIDAYSILESP